ncbi:MAG: thiosulfate oxidation carrier protein SoxY [Inquilinus sp.]|nr:thiosulfate oxidation carrier protein SoxY [Inquilinus sp.]
MAQVRLTTRTVPVTRREILRFAGIGLIAAAAVPLAPGRASATADDVSAIVAERFGGAEPKEGRIDLVLPEIAENGNTVPVSVRIDSPMTTNDYVKSVSIFAEGNPLPEVATFRFTPRSGVAEASTRMRLAGTQNVVAVAQMSDGSVYMAKKEVKVTIGGCGG